MDIRLPLNGLNQATLNKLISQPLTLKLGQQLDGQVLNTELQAGKITVTLKLGNDTVTLQSNQAITLIPGQNLQLQVIKLSPIPEFKIINTALGNSAQIMTGAILVPLKTFTDANLHLPQPSGGISSKSTFNQASVQELTGKQILEFKVVGFSGDKIQLQMVQNPTAQSVTTQSTATNSTKTPIIIIDRARLQPLQAPQNTNTSALTNNPGNTQAVLPITETLKIGQHLTLEVIRSSSGIDFKILPHIDKVLDQQINQLVKQFLPKHESSPVLLNQLIKDLPQLLKNNHLPETLKQVVITLLENLPGKEQLMVSSGLKQALNNSGLLMETKLVTPSDKQEVDLKLDFKGNLLKLVHLLKQELQIQNQQGQESQDLDILKNLQQKTENTLAKIALEQLSAFPKEDNAKQIWNFEIPFFNNGNAEAMAIQIQWEKHNTKQIKQSDDWSVQITIAPPRLGTINCTIAYQNKIVSTYFKSLKNHTTALITEHLDDLKKQLEASGLTTGQLISQHGSTKPNPSHRLLTNKLFDEQA